MAAQMSRTTEEWEAEIGSQVRSLRLRADRTQADVARAANVSVSTLASLEHGEGSSLSTLVSVVRALDRADWLTTLEPPVTVSPLELLARRRGAGPTSRVRASGRRT
ncbi:MAG: helix-turn-helix transcriptional regulator [Acidimicrobiales bacterium]|nr:helix-turn-helix transcriptional regulator [Acidimicrobiales bacterium]